MTRNVRDHQRAQRKVEKAYELISQRRQTKSGSKQYHLLSARVCRLVKPGYYEHFKSTAAAPKFYCVQQVLPQVNYEVDSHVFQVKYYALYSPHSGEETLRELLGKDGFLTPIHRDGYVGPRFRYVGDVLSDRARKS